VNNLGTRWLSMMLATALGFRGKGTTSAKSGETKSHRHFDGLHTRKSRSKKTYSKWLAQKENSR
jgi:hypothetical protein